MNLWIALADAASVTVIIGGAVSAWSLLRIARATERAVTGVEATTDDLAFEIAAMNDWGPPRRPARELIADEISVQAQKEAVIDGANFGDGSLARAAAAYAWSSAPRDKEDTGRIARMAPWPVPARSRRQGLIFAASLIVCEVERLDAIAESQEEKTK